MSDILLIQVPSNATPADWDQVLKALSEARQTNGGDIAREAVAGGAQQAIALPIVNVAPPQPQSVQNACQACGGINGSHKSDCMFAAQNRPVEATAAQAAVIPPFPEPASNPMWLDDFVSANNRLPENGEISDNWMHIVARLKGINNLTDDLSKLRKQANAAKARAVKAWNEQHKSAPTSVLPPAAPVQQMTNLLGSLPPAAQAAIVPPSATTQRAAQQSVPVPDFQHVTQLTDAQRAALAAWVGPETKVTPQRVAIVQAFLTGQATSEHLKAITTRQGTFYDKVKSVISKA